MDEKRMWCRNCGEETTHEKIGTKRVPYDNRPRVMTWLTRRVDVYACKICGCRTDVGPGHRGRA